MGSGSRRECWFYAFLPISQMLPANSGTGCCLIRQYPREAFGAAPSLLLEDRAPQWKACLLAMYFGKRMNKAPASLPSMRVMFLFSPLRKLRTITLGSYDVIKLHRLYWTSRKRDRFARAFLSIFLQAWPLAATRATPSRRGGSFC